MSAECGYFYVFKSIKKPMLVAKKKKKLATQNWVTPFPT
jgi:hypothetical protein